MPSNNRSSGNWGPKQDKDLGAYLRANTINYRIRMVNYLFGVMEEIIPNFILPCVSRRNAAIQRKHGKFPCYEQDLLTRRGKFLLMRNVPF
jgi:hypothetical protein